MITIQGKGVSAGIGMGPLYFYRRAKTEIPNYTVEDTNAEWLRFKGAQSVAIDQLGELAEKARVEAGDEAAFLFETHQMMAEDLDYEEAIQGMIEDGHNAEYAVDQVAYMQGRAADVKDVSSRILGILCGVVQGGIDSAVPVLLASDDLAPSETIQLDKTKILGFVTSFGSSSSHTAILARTLGIPSVVGLGDQLDPIYEGRQVVVDGATGAVIVDPTEDVLADFTKKRDEQLKQQALLQQLKGQENVTKDGKSIRIYCNIGSPEDVDSVLVNDGGGIGLFRSEFLYLNSKTYPTEEEQFEAYKKVLTDMGDKEVIIRTCDIGADKQIDYFELPKEENPAMGMRALRISLSRPGFFRTQLRALYRASAYGNLGIMFPMVTSVWEVRETKKLIESVKKELDAEGLPYSDHVEIGIMIETPAAAVLSDRLAKEVDFFSCGTNDLTQYTLACDRQNNDLGRFYDPHHLSVVRLLKMVVENAHKNGVWVGICGELGADLEMTETFLAIGVDELSVSPRAVLPLRNKVRNTNVGETAPAIIAAIEGDETPKF